MLSAVILSEHGYPAMPLARQLEHQRSVHPGPLVLGTDLLKYQTPTVDMDRTVSRRSEPSSRTTLIGEQPNPWDLLQPQDVMSRHRGAKLPRRYELLGGISLLSPAYLLSDERWPVHLWTTGSLSPCFHPARLVGLAVKPAICFCAYRAITDRTKQTFERLRYRLGGDRPSQTTRLSVSLSRITGAG